MGCVLEGEHVVNSFFPVTLDHSQTAASPVTCGLSCPGETRKEDVVVAMIEIKDVEVGREDEDGEGKPTEEDGEFSKVHEMSFTTVTSPRSLILNCFQQKHR